MLSGTDGDSLPIICNVSTGVPISKREARRRLITAATAIEAIDKPYNNTTLFLFDLNQ
jgi:hypothetical protein